MCFPCVTDTTMCFPWLFLSLNESRCSCLPLFFGGQEYLRTYVQTWYDSLWSLFPERAHVLQLRLPCVFHGNTRRLRHHPWCVPVVVSIPEWVLTFFFVLRRRWFPVVPMCLPCAKITMWFRSVSRTEFFPVLIHDALCVLLLQFWIGYDMFSVPTSRWNMMSLWN